MSKEVYISYSSGDRKGNLASIGYVIIDYDKEITAEDIPNIIKFVEKEKGLRNLIILNIQRLPI